MPTLHLIFLLSLLVIFFCVGQHKAYASDSSPGEDEAGLNRNKQLAETDRALFLELAELARFNIHFHLEANRHQKWRGWSYALGRESGTAVSFAGTLIDLKEQAQGLDSLARISRNELKRGVACGIVGSAVSGGASALELAQNAWVMLKAKEKGYSPSRSLAFVKNIVANTDRLLAVRERLATEEQSSQRRRVIELETQLVRRIRQQLLFEFGTWSAHSRDQAWRENTFYAIDSLQSFTRMGTGIIAMKAFNNPELVRSSVICALVASSAATVNPIVRNLVGRAVRKHQQHKLAAEIPFERTPMPAPELDELQQELSKETDQGWPRKIAALTYRSEQLDKILDRETRDIERYRQVAQQQSISGPLIGLTGVASASLAAVAVFEFRGELETVNKLAVAGRITQATGLAYALLNTPYTIIRGMIKNRQLKKRGELPSQILEERLKKLERF